MMILYIKYILNVINFKGKKLEHFIFLFHNNYGTDNLDPSLLMYLEIKKTTFPKFQHLNACCIV